MPPLDQFRVRDKLFQILKTAGATETVFSPRQILSYLGKYIELKNLHDSQNIRIVRCKGDLLEDIFGVEEFVIGTCKDIWHFILPHLLPVLTRDSANEENKAATSESNDNIVTKLEHSWMTQLPWWYFVQKPEQALTATGSIADNSTAVVKDSEYTSDFSDSIRVLSRDERFSVEFEPDSDSSFGSGTDSDDTEPVESDDEMTYSSPSIPFTDSSDSSVTDDYWECAVCPNMNPPTTGYCQRCWKFRANWWKPSGNDINPLKSLSLTQIRSLHDVPILPRSSSDPQGVDVTDGKTLKRMRSPSREDAGHSKKLALEREDTLTVMSQSENVPSSISQPVASKLDFTSTDLHSTKRTRELLSSNLQHGDTDSHSQTSLLLSSDHSKFTESDRATSKQQPANVAVKMLESHSNRGNVSQNNYLSKSDYTGADSQSTRRTTELSSSNSSSNLHPGDAEPRLQSTDGVSLLSSIDHNKIIESNCTTSRQQPINVAGKVSESHSNGANVYKSNYTSLPFNKTKLPEMPGTCNICHSHVNDASFVHGDTGHQYCCYRCARKVLKKDGRCPVCREPIEIVIKNYIFQM